MTEQIINWWNGLGSDGKIIFGGIIVFLVVMGIMAYITEIKPYFKSKQKTTTQKYREGLIKK